MLKIKVTQIWVLLGSLFMLTLHGQISLSISGSVVDKNTKAALADAKVSIKNQGLETTTSASGAFSFNGSVSVNGPHRIWASRLYTSMGKIILEQAENEIISISINNIRGQGFQEIYRGALTAGIWEISPASLSNGVYLIKAESERFSSQIKWVSFNHKSEKFSISPSHFSGGGTQTSLPKLLAVDSLIVEKQGYSVGYFPLEGYEQENLTLELEPEASQNFESLTIVPDPSWDCFMPDGIPPPTLGDKVFTIEMEYAEIYDVGETQFGMRRQFDISGGSISGDNIEGSVLSGGLEYELTLANGSMELEQIVILRTNNNTPILMRNAGVAPAGSEDIRVVFYFEAPNSSSYSWLHDGEYVATRKANSSSKKITMEVYDVSSVSLPAEKVVIEDPSNSAQQSWECLTHSGSQGSVLFTENVTLGGSISIGATQGGSRNIIPITGGTMTGKVEGKILNGGADYQMGGLDARYTLAPNDGEYIIVRNCGPGALTPTFETRVGGPYEYLANGKYLSSAPGLGNGGVSITFYEMQ